MRHRFYKMCTSAAVAAMGALICSMIELEKHKEMQSNNTAQRCHGILPRAIGGSVGEVSSWLFVVRVFDF